MTWDGASRALCRLQSNIYRIPIDYDPTNYDDRSRFNDLVRRPTSTYVVALTGDERAVAA